MMPWYTDVPDYVGGHPNLGEKIKLDLILFILGPSWVISVSL